MAEECTNSMSQLRLSDNGDNCQRAPFSSFSGTSGYSGYEKTMTDDTDLNIVEWDVPAHMTAPQYDAVIVHSEDDKEQALYVKQYIEKYIVLGDGKKALLSTVDDDSLEWLAGSGIFQTLEEAVTRSTFIILFITEKSIKDTTCQFMNDAVVMEALNNPLKKWCLVPVYNKPKTVWKKQNIPFMLRSLEGRYLDKILLYSDINDVDEENLDTDFISRMAKMLSSQLCKKYERIKTQRHETEMWMEKESKRRKRILQEQQLKE